MKTECIKARELVLPRHKNEYELVFEGVRVSVPSNATGAFLYGYMALDPLEWEIWHKVNGTRVLVENNCEVVDFNKSTDFFIVKK